MNQSAKPLKPPEQPRAKKRKRDIEVPAAVKHPCGLGFICNFCDRKDPFHSRENTEDHYKICKYGPAAIQQNLNMGFIYKHKTNYVCIHCGQILKSKNAIN